VALFEVGDAGNNKPAFLLWFNDQTTTRIDGPEIPKNEWHYWVGTYDGNTMKLYIDGSQVASASVSKTITTSADPLRIGHYENEWFTGLLDEVRIYSRALSSTEIANAYSENLPHHWLSIESVSDEYFFTFSSTIGDVDRGSNSVEVEQMIYDPYYGWFYFDRFTYGSSTDYNNPMSLQISKDITVTAHYYWYGW
jgi:hypothetical protein